MENLLYQLEKLHINKECTYRIRKDFSHLANHFIAYGSTNWNKTDYGSIERINNLFPYPNYTKEYYLEGAFNCISQHGINALSEIVCLIDPFLQPNMNDISEYVTLYVSIEAPFKF